MRINSEQRRIVINSIHTIDPDARIWLFGSRVDNERRGGDINLAILSSRIGRPECMKIRRSIVDSIGEQKLDIIVSSDGTDPFFRLALEKAVQLDD